MSQLFEIHFIDKSTGNKTQVRGEFQDEDWSILLRFKNFALELLECEPVKNGMRVNYNFNWDAKEGLDIKSQIPSADEIAIFLHRLRPFVLQNEPTYFFRICGILSRYLDHSILRAVITRQRDLFSGKNFQSQIQIKSNDEMLNSDAVLSKWLNAFEYHRDSEKQEELELLHQLLPLERSKAIFLSMMIDKAKAVFEIARMITCLEKHTGEECSFHI